jgi:hypothetical protein
VCDSMKGPGVASGHEKRPAGRAPSISIQRRKKNKSLVRVGKSIFRPNREVLDAQLAAYEQKNLITTFISDRVSLPSSFVFLFYRRKSYLTAPFVCQDVQSPFFWLHVRTLLPVASALVSSSSSSPYSHQCVARPSRTRRRYSCPITHLSIPCGPCGGVFSFEYDRAAASPTDTIRVRIPKSGYRLLTAF